MIITNKQIKNDDDYRKVLKTRMIFAVILIILGAAAFVMTIFSDTLFGISPDSHQVSFYSGMGTGLIFGGVVLFIKYGLIYRNDEKVREGRIRTTDERVQLINSKALTMAGLILFVSIYIIGLIGGLFYPILFKALLLEAAIFLVSYFVIYRVIGARS